jgi:hypothetical protein
MNHPDLNQRKRSRRDIDQQQHSLARQDWTSARFIEEGISIQDVYGTRHAAAFLKNRMIDIDVSLRVLLHPAQRRTHAPG